MTMSSGGEEGKTERKKGRPLITIEKSEIMALLDRPQPLAAQSLGISLSVFKKACRKHGIERWPYQRRWTGKADRLNAPPARSSSSQPTAGSNNYLLAIAAATGSVSRRGNEKTWR
jgi:hypothetical protein